MSDWINFGIIVGSLVFILVIACTPVFEQSYSKKPLVVAAFLGLVGWTVAFYLRIPLIQWLSTTFFSLLGGIATNPDDVARLSLHPLVILWGPLLSGVFEEPFRYLTLRINKPLQKYHNEGPLVAGVAWAGVEILILVFIPLYAAEIIGTFAAILIIMERIAALLIHISFSYLSHTTVVIRNTHRTYKSGLLIAIFLHSGFNSLIVIWLWVFSAFLTTNPVGYYLGLEFTLLLIACLVTFWVWKKFLPVQQQKFPDVFDNNNDHSAPAFDDAKKDSQQGKSVQIDSVF
jgi:uncharacterized membrane protein YhfC